MIIVSDGTLSYNEEKQKYIYIYPVDVTYYCPDCGEELVHRDYKDRIMRNEGFFRKFVIIERLKCKPCDRLHTALPDFLVPYKHYIAEVISGVLDKVVTSEDLDGEDSPCERTMRRWILWFRKNQARIEGYMKSLGYRLLELSEDFLSSEISLVTSLRELSGFWLEKILRTIYNSGGFLVPI